MNYLNILTDSLHNVQINDNRLGHSMKYDEGIRFLIDLLLEARKKCVDIYFIGNGGSAAIACHMTGDFLNNGKMRTINLYNPATFSCFANDYGYEYAFSKQLEALAKKGDILVAISSSGDSQNILNAIDVIKDRGGLTISFTGFKRTNKSREISDYSIYVPSEEYGIVESIHNLILQQIVDEIKKIT